MVGGTVCHISYNTRSLSTVEVALITNSAIARLSSLRSLPWGIFMRAAKFLTIFSKQIVRFSPSCRWGVLAWSRLLPAIHKPKASNHQITEDQPSPPQNNRGAKRELELDEVATALSPSKRIPSILGVASASSTISNKESYKSHN